MFEQIQGFQQKVCEKCVGYIKSCKCMLYILSALHSVCYAHMHSGVKNDQFISNCVSKMNQFIADYSIKRK